MHLVAADTPALRLEQTNGGSGAQTWDVAGNEGNFFVRDVTGGSTLPFRIRIGAPTSSIDINAGGDVGLGVQTAESALHVRRTNGTAQLLVDERSTTPGTRLLADLSNNGPAELRFRNRAAGATSWRAGNSGTAGFAIAPDGGAAALALSPSGDATTSGAVQQNADASAAEIAGGVDKQAVLAKVADLPLQMFEYSADASNARHLAPAGAAFRAAFGLGSSDAAIAPGDIGSVALVAIQALGDRVRALETQVGALGGNVDGLRSLPARLDALTGVDGRAARKVKALEARNRKQDKRLKALEKKLRALARRR
jgi:hypothetical protein